MSRKETLPPKRLFFIPCRGRVFRRGFGTTEEDEKKYGESDDILPVDPLG